MANHQRKIKPEQKRQLLAEAGQKCANPGCANWRLHIHHIRHWAVYKAHDSEHMIAICPACHDAAHIGPIKISDDTLYLWKGIVRPSEPDSAHLYIEPSQDLKLLTGPIALKTIHDRLTVFELSERNYLKFRILDGDIILVSAKIKNKKGKEVLRVVENHVRVNKDNGVKFHSRPGRVQIYIPSSRDYVPNWLLQQVRERSPSFGINGSILALDMEVLKPGLVRVEGCWIDADQACIITPEFISFYHQSEAQPFSFGAYGDESKDPPILLNNTSNVAAFTISRATLGFVNYT
jgi:hypothetical protein